jgi:hypothetical protein
MPSDTRSAGRLAARAGVLVLVASALGCHPAGFEALGAAYHSQHFDYLFHSDDATVCSAVMDALEEHESLLASYLGIDVSAVPRVTYFKLRNENEYQALSATSRGDTAASADKDFVESPLPFDEHELTHTITLGAWGPNTPFLTEGIAVALSCDPSAINVFQGEYCCSTPPVTSYYNVYDVSGNPYGYQIAGAITTYLLDIGGSDKFHQLWASLSSSSSADDFANAIQSVYGFSLDDVWQALQTTPHRPCAPVWMCSLPALTNNEQGTLQSDCTGKHLGRTTNGNLRFDFGGHSGISLIPCSGDPAAYLPPDPEDDLYQEPLGADTWIPALLVSNVVTIQGVNYVIGDLQDDYTTAMTPYATQPLAPATARCSDAQINVIAPYQASALLMPDDAQTHFAHFQLQGLPDPSMSPMLDVELQGTYGDWTPNSIISVALCAGCDGDDAINCNGCPPGTTDCIVRFRSATTAPLWLRIINQGPSNISGYNPQTWSDQDAGSPDSNASAGDASGD